MKAKGPVRGVPILGHARLKGIRLRKRGEPSRGHSIRVPALAADGCEGYDLPLVGYACSDRVVRIGVTDSNPGDGPLPITRISLLMWTMGTMLLQEAYIAAWRFAAQAHANQRMPSSNANYLEHLGMVAMEVLCSHHLEPMEDPLLAVQCAILHDTVEDAGITLDLLTATFGERVAAGVAALTRNEELPKAEAMADSLRRIRQQPKEVWRVKLADRISNLQPPPRHWIAERKRAYHAEAQQILLALSEGSSCLASRLAEKIESYPQYFSASRDE